MVVVLVILTIVLFLLIDWLIAHRTEHEPVAAIESSGTSWSPHLSDPAYVAGFKVQGEMAYHPGHAWAYVEGPARARVGMDDFAHRLIGKADRIELPKPGDWVVQGEPAWKLYHGDRSAAMLAPVTGEVIEVNPRALNAAGNIADAPYEDGWLFRVRAHSLRANLNNLLQGDVVSKWVETVAAQLRMRMSPGFAVAMPDGGTAMSNICELIPDEQWNDVVKESFLTEV